MCVLSIDPPQIGSKFGLKSVPRAVATPAGLHFDERFKEVVVSEPCSLFRPALPSLIAIVRKFGRACFHLG
jgi:hypothetical protein